MGDTFAILTPLLAVAVVIAGAYYTTKWMGKHHNTYSTGRQIQVLERVMLARDTYMALIRVGGKTFLASAASGKVELLREMDPQELTDLQVKQAGNDFFSALSRAIGKGRDHKDKPGSDVGQDGSQT